MLISKIKYEKTFNIGPYLNKKIGIEIDLIPGDDINNAYNIAVAQVEEWHRLENPQLFSAPETTIDPPHIEEPAIQIGENVNISIGVIEECKTLAQLAALKKSIGEDKELRSAYIQKTKQLANA